MVNLVQSRGTLAGAFVVIGVLLATSCVGNPFAAAAIGEVTAADGLTRAAGEDWEPLAVGDALHEGDEVRTTQGEGELALASGQLRLAPNSTVTLEAGQVVVARGDTLATGIVPLALDDLVAVGAGEYRVSAGAAPRLRVYEGEVTAQRLGEVTRVDALRELSLGHRRLPSQPSPLRYATSDAWDRELLATALAFDEEVARLVRGIDRRFGTDPRPGAFYESFVDASADVVPLLAATARHTLADERFGPPAEPLLTLFVARAAAPRLPLASSAERIVELRRGGARWGLIATELDVGAAQLAAAVDLNAGAAGAAGAVDEGEVAMDEGSPTAPTSSSPGAAGPASTGTPGGSGGTGTQASPPRSPSPHRSETAGGGSPSPGESESDPIQSAVEDILDAADVEESPAP